MAEIEIQTIDGPRKVRVCDNCKTVCCTGQFCSSRCAWQADDNRRRLLSDENLKERVEKAFRWPGEFVPSIPKPLLNLFDDLLPPESRHCKG